jgi:hypothetical protein
VADTETRRRRRRGVFFVTLPAWRAECRGSGRSQADASSAREAGGVLGGEPRRPGKSCGVRGRAAGQAGSVATTDVAEANLNSRTNQIVNLSSLTASARPWLGPVEFMENLWGLLALGSALDV